MLAIIKEYNQNNSTETYASELSKFLVCRKEEHKCNKIIKTIQQIRLTMMMLQKKS